MVLEKIQKMRLLRIFEKLQLHITRTQFNFSFYVLKKTT